MAYLKNISVVFIAILFLCSCNDDFSHIPVHGTPRVEYAPNMYNSEAYEPLTQVMDSSSFYANEYNSNPNVQYQYGTVRLNMRVPAANTIKRSTVGNWPFYTDAKRGVYLPYKISADSLDYAAAVLKNPLDTGTVILKDGEILYKKFCLHCHGATGQGDGEVGKKLGGVPQYNGARLKSVQEGYIFHVITHGKGRMGAHASQLNQEERWKIVRYVQTLQATPTE